MMISAISRRAIITKLWVPPSDCIGEFCRDTQGKFAIGTMLRARQEIVSQHSDHLRALIVTDG